MTAYQHFIITAFNIDFGIKSRTEILDSEYLIKRFALFEDICFPSVVRQTNQNFKWLVFFDWKIDSQFKEKIQTLSQYQNFIPIYTPPNCSNYEVFADAVREQLLNSPESIITSNLDNDDALSKDFIQLVQTHYQGQDFEFINFTFGLMINQHGVLLREYFSSPFLSLIEKNEAILTCRVIKHPFLDRLSEQGLPVRQIITHPTWLQMVQGSNVLNKLDVNASIVSSKILDQYFTLGTKTIKKYLPGKYQQYIFKYFNRVIIQNKHKIPLLKRIRNCLNIITPWLSIIYLSMSSKGKHFSVKNISFITAKELCLANAFTIKS